MPATKRKATKQAPRKKAIPVVERVSDLDTLLGSLVFEEHNIVETATKQPDLFRVASEYRCSCMHKRNILESSLKVLEADIALNLRQIARDTGEKITEGSIQNSVITDPDVVESRGDLNNAIELDEFSKLLLEAYRHKRDCLKIVSDLRGLDLSIQRAHGIAVQGQTELEKKVRGKYPRG